MKKCWQLKKLSSCRFKGVSLKPLTNKPQHIAVIMDGNGRWATQRFLPRIVGYKQGLEATRTLIQSCVKSHIPYLTLFAFSSENWRRPKVEVQFLMDLFFQSLTHEMSKLNDNNISLKIIGDITPLSFKLQKAIEQAEQLTSNNLGLQLQVAINYGGQWDMVQALKKIALQINLGEKKIIDITPQLIQSYLSLGDRPNPDLLIRSGGERRISNFLLWQLAYAELYFTDTLWPDFEEKDFDEALKFYNHRERRFGAAGASSLLENKEVCHA